MKINEAIEAIRKVVPRNTRIIGRDITVSVSVTDRNAKDWNGAPKPREIEITVWDGKDHYEGQTLEQAVAACIAANTEDPQGKIEEAEAMLAEVQS